jgi:hypothetical protein
MAKPKHKKYTGNKKHYAVTRPPAPRAAATPAAGATPAARAVAPAPARTASAKGTSPSKQVDFRSEYRYVLGDLKLLGILAATMFTTLIVLALILR